jgi:DNA-binding LacI/PurR family transcriptional regulator
MTTTLRTVAEACGLDISTVSRALRGDPKVASATVAAVRATAERLGYRPNLAARALQAGATRTVWLIAGNLDAEFERRLATGAGLAVEAAGYDLLIASHRDEEAPFNRLMERLDQGITDAALVIAPNGRMPECPAIARLVARRWPLVFLDRSPGAAGIPTVTTDNDGASRAVVRNLHAAGATRLAICPGALNAVATTRNQAAADEARRLGMECSLTPDAAWLSAARTPLAVFATGQGEIHAFCTRYASVLRDIPLSAGVFDVWIGEPHPASLVVVAVQDFAGLATRAAQRVLGVVADTEQWHAGTEALPPLRLDVIRATF